MKLMRLAVLGTLLAFGATNAGATPAEEENLEKMAEAYNAKVQSERRQVVCGMVSKVGTRIKQPQCRTRAQVDMAEDDALRFAKKPKLSFKSN